MLDVGDVARQDSFVPNVRVRNLSYFRIQVGTRMSEICSRAVVDVGKWKCCF